MNNQFIFESQVLVSAPVAAPAEQPELSSEYWLN